MSRHSVISMTVSYLVKNEDGIFLGHKKTGMGNGFFNGFGGHIETNETPFRAAYREIIEECEVDPLSLVPCGFTANVHAESGLIIMLYFFLCMGWKGEPKATAEMVPEFFRFAEIPYDNMWPNDRYTLPVFLDGKSCVGYFEMKDNPKKGEIIAHRLSIMDYQPLFRDV